MERRYTEEHEWLCITTLSGNADGDANSDANSDANGEDIAIVGISAHAVEQLGDVVFVEMPEVGSIVDKGDVVSVVESVKAASDIFSPVSGTIVEVNGDLVDNVSIIVSDPESQGWIFKIKCSEPEEIVDYMTEAEYTMFLEGEG